MNDTKGSTQSTKKKIAIIMHKMIMGGAEKALIEMLKVIDYNEYEVTLLLPESGGDLFDKINHNVNIEFWSAPVSALDLLKKKNIYSFLQRIRNSLMCRLVAKNYAMNCVYAADSLPCFTQHFDCAVCYQVMSPLLLIVTLNKVFADKKVLWVHGRNVVANKNIKYFNKLYNRFDKIFCVSKSTKEEFCSIFTTCAHKTQVVYNFIDYEEIVKKASEPILDMKCENNEICLVTVGRISQIKGFERIPKIARILLDNGYSIKWFIIGDGEDKAKIEKLIAEHAVYENVILLGQRDNPYPYIKQCDIYVQPSYSEGYCTTTNEAKIIRKPIVVTNVSGMDEQFVNGKNGLIVESSVDGLYNGIKTLIDNTELRDKFIENLNKESFNNETNFEKIYNFIQS